MGMDKEGREKGVSYEFRGKGKKRAKYTEKEKIIDKCDKRK